MGRVLFAQIKSPLLLLLVFAAGASALTGEWIDASIVLIILLASVSIGFQREYRAHEAVEALQATVHTRARVVRGGQTMGVPIEEVVPGDVVLLSAGSLVPGDGVVLEEADLFVSEAALTARASRWRKRWAWRRSRPRSARAPTACSSARPCGAARPAAWS